MRKPLASYKQALSSRFSALFPSQLVVLEEDNPVAGATNSTSKEYPEFGVGARVIVVPDVDAVSVL